MKGRNMLALVILVLGAVASFYCYTRLNNLVPMSDAGAVTKADATITEVIIPTVKRNETVSEVLSDVKFSFKAGEKAIQGGYLVRDRSKAPSVGDAEPVAYLTARPEIFLRAGDYDDLPRQLKALRVMIVGFALLALILPFVVMKHGR